MRIATIVLWQVFYTAEQYIRDKTKGGIPPTMLRDIAADLLEARGEHVLLPSDHDREAERYMAL